MQFKEFLQLKMVKTDYNQILLNALKNGGQISNGHLFLLSQILKMWVEGDVVDMIYHNNFVQPAGVSYVAAVEEMTNSERANLILFYFNTLAEKEPVEPMSIEQVMQIIRTSNG
jgi:hypothetical protein